MYKRAFMVWFYLYKTMYIYIYGEISIIQNSFLPFTLNFFLHNHVFKNQEGGKNQAISIRRKKQNIALYFSQTRIVTQEAKCSCYISVPSVGRKTVDKQTMLPREFESMVSRTQTKTEVKY